MKRIPEASASTTLDRSGPTEDAIRSELARVLSSSEFKGKLTLASFLRYIVEQSLAGLSHQIKGYTVATQALGRREDFDAVRDPTVRILAGKLRASLERYYLIYGPQDPVRIEVPKGTYVPVFHDWSAKSTRGEGASRAASKRGAGPQPAGPSIAVMPLSSLSDGLEADHFCDGLTEEMIVELARYQELRVIGLHSVMKFKGTTTSASQVGRELSVRFLLEGTVRREGSSIKVAVRLVDTSTQAQIWGEQYRRDFTVGNLIQLQEEIAARVAASIGGLYGVIPRKLYSELRARPPRTLETYEALLRFHRYSLTLNEATFRETLAILESHHPRGLELGMMWSILAVLYADGNTLWLKEPEATMEKALAYARKGASLEPQNQYARTILAYMLFLVSEREGFFREAEKAIALNPNSPMHIGFLGWTMALYGEWDRGLLLLERGIELNPYYPGWLHAGPCLVHYEAGRYEHAYQEAEQIRMPHLLWDPLLRAATLGQLDRLAEARAAAHELLRLRPDFPASARRLLGYFVKTDRQIDNVFSGLKKAGLAV